MIQTAMRQRVLIFSLGLLLCAAPVAQAQLFGPSDDEKAHEASQDSQLSALAAQNQQLEGRVQVLEDKSRSLTDSLAGTRLTWRLDFGVGFPNRPPR